MVSDGAPTTNAFGQPVGPSLPDWQAPPHPPRAPLAGRTVRVEPLDVARHAEDLFAANALFADASPWTYMAYGPFATRADYVQWLEREMRGDDPLLHAFVPLDGGRAAGVASYLRIQPAAGSIEIGHIVLSPRLQRSVAATEGLVLLMRQAFALGYRRVEWKCDALNAPSRAAATRLGFRFEGLLRQASIYKGRSRDTAWYGLIDREWPAVDAAQRRWLDPANFDAAGRQRVALSTLTAPLVACDTRDTRDH